MPGRPPTPNDIPAHIVLSITGPPASQSAINVLILLHGLGDTHVPFTKLGEQLNLPETVCISLRAPAPLPDALCIGQEGYHWGDDIVFDNSSGGLDVVDVAYGKSVRLLLDEVISGVLVGKCGFTPRDVVIFGFAQGGVVALCAAREFAKRGENGELGGVVSVGGPLASGFEATGGQAKARTPVLVLHGSSRSTVTTPAKNAIRNTFARAEIHEWKKSGDGMPGSREEMLPIMQFFARRLRSRAGVPSGAIEVT